MTGPIELSGTGGEWTDEQIAEFRDALEHADLSRVTILPHDPPLVPPPPREFDFRVSITWPEQGAPMPGRMISIHDADSGEQIYAVTRFALYAEADGVIWARAEMLLGADGRPSSYTGGVLADVKTGDDGEPVTGVFSLLVTQMRMAGPGSNRPEQFGQVPAGPSA